MTRLIESDIVDIPEQLALYDHSLQDMCHHTLAEIAAKAAGKDSVPSLDGLRVAAVPITTGLGIISGFSETVAAILGYLGCDAYVTDSTDIAGIEQAIRDKSDLFFTSDDHTFIAVNPRHMRVSHNNDATARGFGAALMLAAGGLSGREVLLLGAGPVGMAAAAYLLDNGATVTLYDIDENAVYNAQTVFPQLRVAPQMLPALYTHELVYDATPAAAFIQMDMLRPGALLVAPGIPLCMSVECAHDMRGRLVHDALELGVATMLMDVL